jgi:hypothetical protein
MALILFVPLFIAAIFLAFYIPGKVILGESKNISKLGMFAVSIILGFVLWGWQGYVFGFLQLRWLSYVYLLIFLAIFIRKKYLNLKLPKIDFKHLDLIIISIVVLGIFGQVVPFIKTGSVSPDGLFIGSYNYCDHIWHAALSEELKANFPPDEPGLSGIPLANYNFWFHLIVGELSRVFHLPLLSVQFAGLYPLASILLAMVGYVFAVSLYNSRTFVRLFMLFLFFSGDAIGWLFSLMNGRFMLNMSQGLDDATKFMDTPGYGISLLIVLTAFYLFIKNRSKFSSKSIILIGFLIGSLIGFKVYMGFGFMIGFGLLTLYGFFKKKYSYFWITFVAAIFSAIQFLPFNANSGGLFFLPFEAPRGFIAQGGLNLGWIDQRWTIYWQHHNYLRLFEYGIIITIVYLIAQFGIKTLGFIPFKRSIKILGFDFLILLYSILIPSTLISLFFYQKVGGGNIYQFLYPVSIVLTIVSSINLTMIVSKLNKYIFGLIIILIIGFTIPSWIYFTSYFVKHDYFSSFHGISSAELNLYDFLKNSSPQNSMILLVDRPSYNDCPASSLTGILIGRKLFYSGTGGWNSKAITAEFNKRNSDVNLIKFSKSDKKVFETIKNDGINYIIIYNNTPISTSSPLLTNKFLKNIFSNESGKIFSSN